MRISLLLFSFLLIAAAPKNEFGVSSKNTQLLNESSSLRLVEETSVQRLKKSRRSHVGLALGVWSDEQSLQMATASRVVNYEPEITPVVRAQYHYLFGKLGVGASAGYSYREQYKTTPTSLHRVPLSGYVSITQPFASDWSAHLAVGPTYQWLFQQGLDQDVTSQSQLGVQAEFGVSANLMRYFDEPMISSVLIQRSEYGRFQTNALWISLNLSM